MKKHQSDISLSDYHAQSVSEVLQQLHVSEKGLTEQEAQQRLRQYGYNELKVERYISPLKIFLQQFSSPLVWILIAALIVSIILKEAVDAVVIGVIILLNAVMGFVQEFRAEKSIEALQKMTSLKATVLRNGKPIKINSKLLVPGDIILLETGDKVPADARLLEIAELQTDEGSLTGESQPVRKDLQLLAEKTPLADRKNMVYSSTIITEGRGKALVTGTGMQSEVGKIARLIQESHEKMTPLQKKLRDLGTYLTILVVIIAVLVFFAGILSGQTVSVMFLTAIALAVAAIPEGLPAVITISLALGIQRMIKRNALIRKLPSVETLGSVTTICTDKTGTLTHNQMTVTNIWANNTLYSVSGSGYASKGDFTSNNKLANPEQIHHLLKIGLLCNDASFERKEEKREVIGDPTEAALIVSAEKAGFISKALNKEEPRVGEIQFSSERKMMTTLHRTKHGKVSYTKGAPDVILKLCERILINGKVQRLTPLQKKKILKENEKFAQQALRVLGFAYKEGFTSKASAEQKMIFAGLQAMIDPPREEAKQAIQKCQAAGIKVIMITGDHITTAQAIAQQLGIPGKALTGQQLAEMTERQLEKDIKNIGVFARVNPEHKLLIVKALKNNGQVVAMTGDGVNDAPAIKKADIGVAMGITGTDVAKEASDMIVTDDNFTSIVNAVEEGRGIFDNIRKFVNYLLSCNLGEIAVIFFTSIYASIAGGNLFLPLTAIQILWVNLITDGLPATALSLDQHAPGIMQRPPRPPRESILSRELRFDIILFGLLIGLVSFGLFLFYKSAGEQKVQTVVFTALVLFELMHLQTIRSAYRLRIFSNRPLVGAVIISFLLHLLLLYTPLNRFFKTVPLGIVDWLVIIGAGIVLVAVYLAIMAIAGRMKKK